MKEYKVQLNLIMEYNANSEEEIENMLDEEFGLGDKEHEIFIEEIKDWDIEVTHKKNTDAKSEGEK